MQPTLDSVQYLFRTVFCDPLYLLWCGPWACPPVAHGDQISPIHPPAEKRVDTDNHPNTTPYKCGRSHVYPELLNTSGNGLHSVSNLDWQKKQTHWPIVSEVIGVVHILSWNGYYVEIHGLNIGLWGPVCWKVSTPTVCQRR